MSADQITAILAAAWRCPYRLGGDLRSRLTLGKAAAVGAMLALGTALGLWIGNRSAAGMDGVVAVPQMQSAEGKHSGSSALTEVPRRADDKKRSFVLDDLAGTRHDLSHTPGRVVLVHFFATWCEPCREELPMLERLLERSENSALAVFAVSVGEPDDRVRRFFELMPIKIPVVLDRDREVAKTWRIETLPTTYVLDRDLEPRLMVEGEFVWDRVEPEQLLDAVLSVR
jgi:thiol-disulfide isomerase/thioredoxin